MSGKKLSFGFTNTVIKKRIIIPAKYTEAPKSVDLIECLEGQTIKIKDEIIEKKKPLVIPIQPDDKNLLQRVIAANKLKARSKQIDKTELVDNRPDSELTLDELAARQLITEAKNHSEAFYTSKPGASKISIVPAVQDTLILEGSKEPTFNDYENVPIGDFGLAMLRGMGWIEKTDTGKDGKTNAVAVPELRPKGMGLGAFKIVQAEVPEKVALDQNGKELSLVKGACAKIVAGKEKGLYCKIEGFDDESGRIIVKMAIKGTIMSLNEFMLCPVTLDEYSTSSRILNNSKYRDYQEKDSKSSKQDFKTIKTEIKKEQERRSPDISRKEHKHRGKKSRSRDRSTSETDRSRSVERKQKKRHTRHKKDSDYRKYKNRSKSPSNREDAVGSSSKYRSRSRSCDKYNKKQKHQSRRGSSSDSSYSNSSFNKIEELNITKDQATKSKLYQESPASKSKSTVRKMKKDKRDYERTNKGEQLMKRKKNKSKKSSTRRDSS